MTKRIVVCAAGCCKSGVGDGALLCLDTDFAIAFDYKCVSLSLLASVALYRLRARLGPIPEGSVILAS